MRIITPPKTSAGERSTKCFGCQCEFAYRREDTQGTVVSKDFDGISDEVTRFSVTCPGCGNTIDVTGFTLYPPNTPYPF